MDFIHTHFTCNGISSCFPVTGQHNRTVNTHRMQFIDRLGCMGLDAVSNQNVSDIGTFDRDMNNGSDRSAGLWFDI